MNRRHFITLILDKSNVGLHSGGLAGAVDGSKTLW